MADLGSDDGPGFYVVIYSQRDSKTLLCILDGYTSSNMARRDSFNSSFAAGQGDVVLQRSHTCMTSVISQRIHQSMISKEACFKLQLTGGYRAVKVKDGAGTKKHCLIFPETMARTNPSLQKSEGSQISRANSASASRKD